ncbi:thiol-activated cytolysin family protein [uncultured Maribacter sp.]|uniref:thiol-activated cytolysin family protein n=1 Tax=uncultured Maribacter sp. TaxID=431308 RepID=UPI0030EDA968|tara:strand:+ start:37852 stop:39417 length:1566 start_codon:yes stop_codon:yes gene_type:complete
MKTKQSILKYVGVMGLCLLLSMSCSTEEDPISPDQPNPEETEGFNALLSNLNEFSQDEESPKELLDEENPEQDDVSPNLECVVKRYKASPGYDEMLALDPTSDVIYPAGMLKGESIPTGAYIGINGGRAPVTLSVSLENINGKSSVTIDDPKLSTVREGINSILQQGVTGSTPARLNFETKEVYSEEHLNLALGANYRGKNANISASFDFSSSSYKYKYLIKYIQVYYTIDMDLPPNDNPGSLFTALPELNATSPVIVSSVKYGRMVLYTVESNYKETDIHSAFSASFNSADADGNADYQTMLSESSIKATVIGGSGADAAKVVSGPSGIHEYITNGGDYTADSPAAPLSYTLRYIKNDFPISKVVLASEYPIRTCEEAYQKYAFELHGFRGVRNDNEGDSQLELFGKMTATIFQNGVNKGDEKWEKTAGQDFSTEKDKFYEIDQTIEVELKSPNTNDDYIRLYGTFTEIDLFNDDFYGEETKDIKLKDVKWNKDDGYTRIDLEDDPGSEMRIYFHVWRIY